jgi:hypothetical protein
MRKIVLFLCFGLAAYGQSASGGRTATASSNWDLSSASHVIAWSSGTGTPASRACSKVGEAYYQTDAAAGANVWTCTATGTPGTWHQLVIQMAQLGLIIDGGGSVISAGAKGFLTVPYACTIVGYSVTADQSGSIAIEVDKNNSAIPVPTSNKICASACPALATQQLVQSTTLTGWTTAVAANDVLGFQVTGSPASVTRVTIQLNCQR